MQGGYGVTRAHGMSFTSVIVVPHRGQIACACVDDSASGNDRTSAPSIYSTAAARKTRGDDDPGGEERKEKERSSSSSEDLQRAVALARTLLDENGGGSPLSTPQLSPERAADAATEEQTKQRLAEERAQALQNAVDLAKRTMEEARRADAAAAIVEAEQQRDCETDDNIVAWLHASGGAAK